MARIKGKLTPLLALLAVFSGCESGPVDPPPLVGNVTAYVGADTQVNDTAVVVDGRAVVTFGDVNRSLWLEHQVLHEYGGIGSFETDVLRSESWFVRFSHRLGPRRPDAPYVDHGEVRLADTMLWKHGDPHFLGYGTSVYAHREYLDGREITFAEASYLPAVHSGSPLSFSSTGSEQAGAFATVVSARPKFVLTHIESGRELDFRRQRPEIRASDGFVLRFDRPLDPARLAIRVGADQRIPGASAYLRLNDSSDRIVIPGSVLSELLAKHGGDSAEYVLILSEYHTDREAITGRLLPAQEPYALDFVQHNILRIFFSLKR
ncbi:MAG TPA: hypothetical protein VGR27_14305 [Longimicrobiaceae bacterium]|nr:hypothetical protein [Longimicrobiaceae bacterium]